MITWANLRGVRDLIEQNELPSYAAGFYPATSSLWEIADGGG